MNLNIDRVAFEILGHPIYWYGIFFVAGILIGYWTGMQRSKLTTTVSVKQFSDAIPWALIGILIGARALFVITYWDEYFAKAPWTAIFDIRSGGLVFFGGLICGIAATMIYLLKNKIPIWPSFDIAAPSMAIGHACGRIGCFLNGCCYGHSTSCSLGVCYPDWHETHGIPIHPVQLYESGLNLLLFFLLEYLFRHHRKYDGQIVVCYLIGYGLIRFTTEFFRGDVPKVFLSLSQAQCIAIALFFIGLGLHFFLSHKHKQKQEQPPSQPSTQA